MIDRANVLLLTVISAASAGMDRVRREEGQTFVEYALVILLIAVAVTTLAAWDGLRDMISQAATDIANTIDGAGD
jgi:Flp pilus assembly pilin Flp